MKTEYGICYPIEVREEPTSGRMYLEGTVIKYGDVATIGDTVKERFAPGSIQLANYIAANRQHQRHLILSNTNSGLRIIKREDAIMASVPLPNTTEGKDTITMVQDGILAGFSPEFTVKEQHWEGPIRTIKKAILHGVGVVDKGAYGLSKVALIGRMAEKRHKDENWAELTARWVF